jgi:chromate transporter
MVGATAELAGKRGGTPLEVLWAFLRMGVTSFGGPIAHIGYFHQEFVVRRRWLDEQAFADLVALCQFLPGPASSQVGFTIGLMRAGYAGALCAWIGFTLPSATALVLYAYAAPAANGPIGLGVLHGLKLVAVAIVAQAVLGMVRTLTPDRARASMALMAALIISLSSSSLAQLAAIIFGGALGWRFCRETSPALPGKIGVLVSQRVGLAALAAFVLAAFIPGAALFEAFYRSGALVFGGGHVVLPLLREAFVGPGWIGDDAFLSGYGAAQAIPGPLFSFAAYLGAVVSVSPHGLPGAALGLVAIFLPGMLLILGVLPFWESLRRRSGAQAIMRGINAAVVGVLAAALYNPLWTTSVHSSADFGVAMLCFVLLTAWRVSALWVVIAGAALGGMILG